MTFTVSPALMTCEGLTLTPFMVTRPFLHAVAAIERVLKILAAHSHLSILAVSFAICVFVVKLVHCNVKACQYEAFDYFNGFFDTWG